MALTPLSTNLNNIQALADKPSMTSAELKTEFDKAGNAIKSYINNTLIGEIETKYVATNDARLTNSRKCNNSFDTPLTARSNLKIKTGTSLPSTVEEDCLFFLYS